MPRMAQWLKVRNAEGAEASFSAPGSKASTLPQREDPRIWYSFAVECASEGDFLPLRRRAIVSPKDCGWQIVLLTQRRDDTEDNPSYPVAVAPTLAIQFETPSWVIR
jgi:hypothetical protein